MQGKLVVQFWLQGLLSGLLLEPNKVSGMEKKGLQVKGAVWLGIRTSNFEETVKFFKGVIG